MKNIIDYLLIFISIIWFLPDNIFALVYIASSAFLLITYWILYFINIKRGRINKEQYQFNLGLIIMVVMIFSVNIIKVLSRANLIFAGTMLLILLLEILLLVFRKNKEGRKSFFEGNLLFDFYSIIYLGVLVMEVLSCEL